MTIESVAQSNDMVWLLVAAALVMTMQIGFLLLEAGMVRSKNSINVAQKNLLDFTFSVLIFGAVGFMFAFGADGFGLPVGFDADLFLLSSLEPWDAAYFVFEVMFCGTAATIVSGAVAERMKLPAYVLGSIIVAGLIYPMFAHWAWGNILAPNQGAFLANLGFVDFAGSTVVHATGAWVALAAVLIIGPRLGRFTPEGKPVRIAGHSPVLATAGGLLLFFGWIGFNGGSTLTATPAIAHIILNTVMAAAAGGVAGFWVCRAYDKVVLPEKTISGMIGGLVAVTAGCMVLDPAGATAIGFAGGLAAVAGNLWLEHKMRIDDAVGAIGVHGFAGVVGTLLLALLAPLDNLPLGDRVAQLGVQALGAGINFIWAFGLGLGFFAALDRVTKLRVDAEAEHKGLNESVHATKLGVGHVEEALGALVEGRADLESRLEVEPGDEAEYLTRLFNALMDNLQREEEARSIATELKRSDEEAERLATLADATFEALCISVDDRIIDGNGALEKLVDVPISALKGRNVCDFIAPEYHARIVTRLQGEGEEPEEIALIDVHGNRIPVEIRGRDIIYRGTHTRVSAIVDLRDRKKAEAKIRFLAQHDPLTDLPNRALFNEKLNEMIARTAATGAVSAVLLIDLDRFKDINDLHGHPAGDEVIKLAAKRLRAVVRATDMVARLGGDEFAVLQDQIEFANQAEDLAHRIVTTLAGAMKLDKGMEMRVGASVGVALCPRDGLQPAQLVSRADTALYEAKKNGRNQYALFEPGMDADLRRRQLLEGDLLPALQQRQFELYFQPRLDVARGRIVGYEALIRWNHPKRGFISPVEFIPVAEHSGKIVPIGTWVLHEACQMAMRHLGEARVSVNVSALQFREKQFIETVATALAKSGLPADRLEIEITESVLINDDKRAIVLLNQLQALGVRIALDDFGTGYSSLGYLSRFPFDTIKIDRAFLKNIRSDSGALAIVDTIIRLGRALDMNIVAEGLEHLDEVTLLAKKGCDEIQGYILGHPRPVSELVTGVSEEVAAALAAVSPALHTETGALRNVARQMRARRRGDAETEVKRQQSAG